MALSVAVLRLMIAFLVSTSAISENNETQEVPLDMPNDQGILDEDIRLGCINWQGKLVADGQKYIPNGNDMCMQCTCDRHFPIMCHSVACSPPLQCASPKLVQGACCEYVCLDDGNPENGNGTDTGNSGEEDEGESITNLSLRLIASTVTSFLVLALLLFMVHRLRQRRLLMAMRRFEARSNPGQIDDTDSEPYIPDAFLALECPPYTDPPPPYSPPKPPQILPGEQPPPYDEITNDGQAATRTADENRNDVDNGEGRPASGTLGQGGHVASMQRTHHDMGMNGSQQVSGNCQLYQSDGLVARSECVRPPNILPAYASTDVVEGLGVVISPGTDLVCYNPGWPNWQEGSNTRIPDAGQASRHMELSGRDVSQSPGPMTSCRAQTMPTTAFQRFSNLFKADSWRAKSRRRGVGRPLSDCSTPPHYASVPRQESTTGCPSGGEQASRGGNSREDNYSSRYARWFPGRMCASYDSSQGVYTLAHVSPSTSSSSSSHSCEPCRHQNTSTSNTTSASTANAMPVGSSSTTDTSSPTAPYGILEDSSTSSVHTQPYHSDGQSLPQQSSDESSGVDISGRAAVRTQRHRHSPLDVSSVSETAERNAPNIAITHTLPNSRNFSQTPLFASPHTHSPHIQQSLGAFIRSHPLASLSGRAVNSDPQSVHPHSDPVRDESSHISVISPQTKQQVRSVASSQPVPDNSASVDSRTVCSGVFVPNQLATASPPSPSPSPPAVALGGPMRRSQSGTSQISIFSVCSETGEKKLKIGDKDDTCPIIPADGQYPVHPSLTRSKHLHRQEQSSELKASPLAVEHVTDNSEYHNVQALVSKIEGACHNISSPVAPVGDSSSVSSPSTHSGSSKDRTVGCKLENKPDIPVSGDLGHCGKNDHNFNSSPTMKASTSKELPWDHCHHMSQSVNIPPLPAFANTHSSRQTHALKPSLGGGPVNTEAKITSQTGRSGEKRSKKKRNKDRNHSSPQFGQSSKGRHGQASPRRRLHAPVGEIREGDSSIKAEETGMKWPRTAEPRHRIQLGTMRTPMFVSNLGNQSSVRCSTDAPMLYGNADVYRGAGETAMGTAICDPPAYMAPWNGKDHSPRHSTETLTAMNDLNQPPSHIKAQVGDRTSSGHAPGASESTGPVRLEVNAHGRKKGGHKRQASASEKLGQGLSPVRHKTRPKSLATLDGYERHASRPQGPWDLLPPPSVTIVEQSTSGRGVKSGFGHDLNFDDQNGIADHHSQDVEISLKKAPLGSESHQNIGTLGIVKKLSRGDGPQDSNQVANRTGTWSGGGHHSSKSGLSNDLSFTSRSATTMAHPKKRQSVPAISGLSPSPHERGSRSGGQGGKSRHSDGDNQIHLTHHRAERANFPSERRLDRSGDCSGETTSYV